ncbi:MAG TPA: 6-pyruvoyl-tetrahydropterin synthase-related protein [Anaerolineae bacterium]|nr:6-pyruvoyl-tetrahydropterin synthase-related protein [Anaerolineae bacterium]HQH38418.1 6-pyruvoyl-tetrahydropterin synthase-related protein [Anaerolineae bacterium]
MSAAVQRRSDEPNIQQRASSKDVHASRLTPRVLRFTFYVLLAFLAAAPLWGPGMVNTRGGGDSPFLLQRTLDMAESLRNGIFPPRWMAHAAYDLGYPFFNYYAALPYYLSGGLTALGLSPLVAIQATQTFGFVLAAAAMALWAERVLQSRAAVSVAVAAYTFAPFHLVNVYVRGDSLSEFYAFIWYPLILWTLDRVAERPTRRRIMAASLAYGALILTHNTSALVFSPFALLYAVVRMANGQTGESVNSKSKIQNLKFLMAPFILGFLLTAWFWLPALGETKYGQMGPEFTAGYFHYSQHFRGLNLIQRTFAFDYSVAPRAEDAGPFAMGLVQAVLAAAGVVSLIVNGEWPMAKGRMANHESRIPNPQSPPTYRLLSTVYFLFGLALATFMITPLSKPLWDHLPLLEITQFPWRFLSVQALFTAVVTGALVDLQIFKSENLKTLVVVGLWGMLIVAALVGLHPERLRIDDEDVTWDRLLFYETFTGNIGTTIRYEYLPRDVSPRLYISEAVVDGELRPMADGGGLLDGDLLERTPIRQVWQVTVDAGGATVAFPLNGWPGWQADVDGVRVEAFPLSGSGRLAVSLPVGEHTVTLHLCHTPLRTVAEALSGLTLIGLVIGVLAGRKSNRMANYKLQIANFLFLVDLLVLCMLIPGLLHRPSAASGTFFDFNQMPYPHGGPVDFGVAQLENATSPATTVHPGDVLTVTHTWSAVSDGPLTGTLRLVSPAEPRHGVPYALAEATFALPCDGACVTPLLMPDDLSRGLYLLEIGLEASDTIYSGAVRVPHGPALAVDAPTLATFTDLTLHAVEPYQPDPTTLRLKMVWSTPGTPRNWTLSLRLLDASGRQLVQNDIQPGYGYLPTTLWMPGEMVTDYPVLTLPEGLAPGDYTLRIVTYLLATMEGGGQADIPIRLTAATLYDLRDACCEQTRKGATILCQADDVALLTADLPPQLAEGNSLDFYATWNALAAPAADLTARWEVLDAAGVMVGSTEGMLAPGSPTSAWPRHTWVRAPVHVDLPPVLSPGAYDVRLRLGDGGEAWVVCTFRAGLTVTPRPRVFAVPPISHPQEADFGGEIRLLGYAMQYGGNEVTLTLWWQATTTPSRDYKRFIHLYEPTTEVIAVQDDAMPRAWTYPTTWWAAGEVVSETVTLDVSAVPPGDYRLGVGWYDPATLDRLPATDAGGQPQPLNRVTLDAPLKR